MTILKTITVTTTCPFCGGSKLLLSEVGPPPSIVDLTARFVGTHVDCDHPGCGKDFWVRRGDLTVRGRTHVPAR